MEKKSTIPWWNTSFDDREVSALAEAVRARKISQGDLTAAFERRVAELLGVPFAVATTSCTMALYIAFYAAGIRPGDEVILPDRTFIATAHAAQLAGAVVRLIDTQRDLPLIDPGQIEAAITPKTRAIVPVHLCGRVCDMDALRAVARKHSLLVIEDAAQSIFSRSPWGYAGTVGDVGCFSFGMAKLISTGQGGMIVTSNERLHKLASVFRTHSVADTFHATYTAFGLNLRFTDMQAAIGLVQLEKRKDKIAHVQKLYELYAAGLASLPRISVIPVKTSEGEVPNYVEILVDERDRLVDHLAQQGIDTRPFLPCPHRSPHLRQVTDRFPNAERFEKQGLFLPSGPSQPVENAERCIDSIRKYYDR
jgi:dTDP-4-amino-4,6-dideoxygalactose transaminase